jgi:hypothetical protein
LGEGRSQQGKTPLFALADRESKKEGCNSPGEAVMKGLTALVVGLYKERGETGKTRREGHEIVSSCGRPKK